MTKLSVVADFIRQGIAKRKEAKKTALQWRKNPEMMLNLAAADMIEEILDGNHYNSPGNTYMCIALRNAKERKDGRTKQVYNRAKNIIMLTICPENTLIGYLGKHNLVDSSVYGRTERFVKEHGIPYYRELIKKIRYVAHTDV